MPQIQVLFVVNREAATAHQPFMLRHFFTWALNMPGQDNCYHFGGRLKAFCQHPVVGVVKQKCDSGCTSCVTMQMLMNYRQTGKRAQQRDEEHWMIIPMCVQEAMFVCLCSVGNKRVWGTVQQPVHLRVRENVSLWPGCLPILVYEMTGEGLPWLPGVGVGFEWVFLCGGLAISWLELLFFMPHIPVFVVVMSDIVAPYGCSRCYM